MNRYNRIFVTQFNTGADNSDKRDIVLKKKKEEKLSGEEKE